MTKRISFILTMTGLLPALFLLLSPATALAKRMAPAKVPDVTHEGVRYQASQADGTQGRVVAYDAQTGKKLWDKVIYQVTLKPDLEQDVQWVFIREMTLKGDALIIVNERGATYSLDLKTKEVRELKPAKSR